jgi:SPOR domain
MSEFVKVCVIFAKIFYTKMFLRLVSILFVWLFVVGCASAPIITSSRKPAPTTPSTPSNNESYDEDFSVVRPRYKETTIPENLPKKVETKTTTTASQTNMVVNKQVDAILDTMAIQNKALRYAVGYRIQIYVGNLRTDADAAKLFTYQTYPELLPYMTFTSPTYRVKVGDFMNKLDAERYFQQLRQQFPSSVILQDKIDLKKSLLVK